MPQVMIHPANYGNVRQAVDRAFELFPLELQGKRVLIGSFWDSASRGENR